MKKFNGTSGKWMTKTIENDSIKGTESSKVYNSAKSKVICRVNATHKKEGHYNLKLIENSKDLLNSVQELLSKLDSISDELPNDNDTLFDRIQLCKSIVKKILK